MSRSTKDTEEQGQRSNEEPTKGPIENRSCTDILCCLLFFICVLGMIACGVWGYLFGNPTKLLYPTDSAGHLCGYGDKTDKPNLFFFDLLDCAKAGLTVVTTGCPTEQVCVETCPKNNWVWLPAYTVEETKRKVDPNYKHTTERDKMICKYSVNPSTDSRSIKELVTSGDCASYYVDSAPIVHRCVPSIFTTLLNKTSAIVTSKNSTIVDQFNKAVSGTELENASRYLSIFLNAIDYGVKILQDVRASWWLILVFLGMAMILSLVWIIIMRWIAGPMVWFTILAFIALFAFATYWCVLKYLRMRNNPSHQGSFKFTLSLSYYTNLSTTWLVLGIISGVILLMVLLIFIFLRSRILIAIAVINEASKALGYLMFALLWPVIPFLLQVILFVYWGATAVFLASLGRGEFQSSSFNLSTAVNTSYNSTLSPNMTSDNASGSTLGKVVSTLKTYIGSIPCNPSDNTTAGSICAFVKYGGDQYTIYLQIYMLFMLLWVMNFIIALGQVTLAGAFASYYWAKNKPADIPTFPLTASLCRTLRYHLGSVAFGSLIIAIIQAIRVILEYLDHKFNKNKENPIASFFLKCLKCCFWCLEKIMKFINKNAYILIAVYGKNFCTSAKDAFQLILRNIVRAIVIDKVTDFLLFIGKLVITGAVGVGAFFFFSGRLTFLAAVRPTLVYYLIPVIIIGVGSYVIAACFFSVYSMGVDTLFLCFLKDCDENDGNPQSCSNELLKILGKKKKKKEESDNDD